jgi:hypothetical protein
LLQHLQRQPSTLLLFNPTSCKHHALPNHRPNAHPLLLQTKRSHPSLNLTLAWPQRLLLLLLLLHVTNNLSTSAPPLLQHSLLPRSLSRQHCQLLLLLTHLNVKLLLILLQRLQRPLLLLLLVLLLL